MTKVLVLIVLSAALLGVTKAEQFSTNSQGVAATRPADFVVAGTVVARVLDDGRCDIKAATLTPQQAKDLRSWIKDNFVDPIP